MKISILKIFFILIISVHIFNCFHRKNGSDFVLINSFEKPECEDAFTSIG